MFQALKKKYLVRYIVLTVIAFICSMVILAVNADGIKVLLTPKADLNELYAAEITTPMRVDADIDFILDYYTYTTKNGVTTEKGYFIPVGEAEYMGVALGKSYLSKADSNIEATWDYMGGNAEAIENLETIHVTGTILPLEGQEKYYYQQYIDDLGWTEEEQEIFLPYVLKVNYIGNYDMALFVVFMVLAAVLFISGIVLLVLGLKGSYLKNIRKYCEASGNPEVVKGKLEQFYAMTPEVCGMRISPEYFLAMKGYRAQFTESKNIIWVYQHVTKQSVNLIPVAKTYSIILVNADGSRIEIGVKGKKTAEKAIEHIAHVLPYLFFGYDDELQKAFRQNRQAMIQAVAERRSQFYSEPTSDISTENTTL